MMPKEKPFNPEPNKYRDKVKPIYGRYIGSFWSKKYIIGYKYRCRNCGKWFDDFLFWKHIDKCQKVGELQKRYDKIIKERT